MLKLDQPINEVVNEYPIIGKFLQFNNVDCVNCSVSSCLVKDILEIHNFSKSTQLEMQAYMELLLQDDTIQLKEFKAQENKQEYTHITSMLIEEHKLIMELIYITEYIISKDNFMIDYNNEIQQLVTYFKEYADDFHHGKEEDVLFCLFEKNDILQAMYQEHEQGRDLRKQIIAADNDEALIKNLLIEYTIMLKEHIYKEDNILFPYLDRNLSTDNINDIEMTLSNLDLSINQDVQTFINEFNNKQFMM